MSQSVKQTFEVLPETNLLEPGDLVAIPLEQKCYGFARRYNDAELGVFDIVSSELLTIDILKTTKIAFYVPYCEPTDETDWIYLGKWPFNDDSEAWADPRYIYDRITSTYEIYHKGRCIDASELEVKGLQDTTMLFPENIVNRIQLEIQNQP